MPFVLDDKEIVRLRSMEVHRDWELLNELAARYVAIKMDMALNEEDTKAVGHANGVKDFFRQLQRAMDSHQAQHQGKRPRTSPRG